MTGLSCLHGDSRPFHAGVGRALAEEFLRLGDSVVITSRSGKWTSSGVQVSGRLSGHRLANTIVPFLNVV